MPVQVIVGAQWGDEGKGKIVDLLSANSDIVARCQGGANAGHSIEIGEKYVLHLIPSGILHPHTQCYIGSGVVLDPFAFLEEINFLTSRNIDITNRIFISHQTHLVLPYHKLIDQAKEAASESNKIGTTCRGIGPAYSDKASRTGIRLGEIFAPERFKAKLERNIDENNAILKHIYHRPTLDKQQCVADVMAILPELRKCCADVSLKLSRAIDEGKKILIEGAQGTLLDLDFGTYPYVTSSNTTSGGACTGLGIAPARLDSVLGVSKAYLTRVGLGPFPTEITDAQGDSIRQLGKEFGATTGRPRRCGWFDAVLARYAVRINGINSFALTKLDVLDTLEEIKVCIGYRYKNDLLTEFTSDLNVLDAVHPEYKCYKGWQRPTGLVKSYDDLPENAKAYIREIEELVQTKISIISLGPERNSTLFPE
ncbi:adenylosuccinate synthase [candidate division KSB1 bacterium]|nr:adenylosuccinate synthase [candidate division KSB1 bacterium]